MTGWNMPPGCNVSDTPGNRPEDQEAEAFYDAAFDAIRLIMSTLPDEVIEKITDWAWKQMGEAYSRGYQDGVAEEAVANEFQQTTIALWDG